MSAHCQPNGVLSGKQVHQADRSKTVSLLRQFRPKVQLLLPFLRPRLAST